MLIFHAEGGPVGNAKQTPPVSSIIIVEPYQVQQTVYCCQLLLCCMHTIPRVVTLARGTLPPQKISIEVQRGSSLCIPNQAND